ncbi:MAG: hypothetical protein Q9160_004883 [Pyrenula sp. 1 TL-2023]
MHRKRDLIFRIFYSTTFTVIFLVLLAHVLVAPADAVYQAYKKKRLVNVFVVAGVYVVTAIIAAVLYASRLYTNRSILNAIPKTYVPVEEGDVGRSVRRIIADGIAESALIAYEAKPRTAKVEALQEISTMGDQDDEASCPSWGIIAHPGWSSPASPDLPNLQYETVVTELPDLIEAKAVSLAPSVPADEVRDNESWTLQAIEQQEATNVVDEAAVQALRRPDTMGLHEYMAHLADLNLINPPGLGNDFLEIYERARFSAGELDEATFRYLMGVFAEILRGMSYANADFLGRLSDGNNLVTPDGSSEEGEVDDDDVLGTISRSSPELAPRSSHSESEQSLRTTPKFNTRRHNSGNTSATVPRITSTHSLHRLRSQNSNLSRSTGRSGESVIRLSEAHSPLDLPYTINL